MKIEGLPVIDVDEREEITVAEGDTADPERHPIAIALRRQGDVDDTRVTKNETLVIRRGKKWFRYDAPDKRLFNQLQRTLTTSDWYLAPVNQKTWIKVKNPKAPAATRANHGTF
jgi:hypothetical protein